MKTRWRNKLKWWKNKRDSIRRPVLRILVGGITFLNYLASTANILKLY